MSLSIPQQLILMAGEALLAASLLLMLFRHRRSLGLAPTYMTLGVLYYMASELASTLYVPVAGLSLTPGSVAIFPANLFVALLLYVNGDVRETRKLIYGIVAANLSAAVLSLIMTLHLPPNATLQPRTVALLIQQPRIAVVGSLTLYLDTILIVILYQAIRRFVRRNVFLQIWIPMAAVLVFDTFVFVTGSFVESPAYPVILVSGLVGKLASSVIYSGALAFYLTQIEPPQLEQELEEGPLRRIFQFLTYRERYQALRDRVDRDPLTGIYNRGFFDAALAARLDAARESGHPLTLLLIDIDRFKETNDVRGHQEGDRILKTIATLLGAAVRATDFPCRYGGDEFAILLVDTELSSGLAIAERIRTEVPRVVSEGEAAGPPRVTVTIGLASFPADARTAEALVALADSRLYAGKRSGRDRAVAAS